MPKEPNPDVVLHKLRTLALKHGWVLARWDLRTPEYHEQVVLTKHFSRLQRQAIRDPRRCTSKRVAAALVRKGIFTEAGKLTSVGRRLQARLKSQRWLLD